MKIHIRLALAALLLFVPASAFAQNAANPPLITVTGEANVSAAPDSAEVTGGVTSDAKTAREASEANNKAMAAVLAALKGAGIAEADIRTSRLSLQPQFASGNNARPQITAYRASNNVTVRIRDVSRVAATIDTLVGAGANDIGGIDFTVTNASKLLDEARVRAIAEARRKAEIYAKAANVALGAPITISEEGAPAPIPMRRMNAAVAASTPVAPGEETLTVSVLVAYEIKPAQP